MSYSSASLEALYEYTACDVSDALLKLRIPHAGFLPDFLPYAPVSSPLLIGPASTALFLAKEDDDDDYPPTNIPSGQHWVDLITPGTVLIQSQPVGQRNAVLGGIMAMRLKVLGVEGVVTHGRVRDIAELKDIGLPVFAKGTSTVGQGLSTKPHALDVPITISDVTIRPLDIVFADPINGVVIIPREKLEEVLELLPKIVSADAKVMEAVEAGMTVKDAFAKFR